MFEGLKLKQRTVRIYLQLTYVWLKYLQVGKKEVQTRLFMSIFLQLTYVWLKYLQVGKKEVQTRHEKMYKKTFFLILVSQKMIWLDSLLTN